MSSAGILRAMAANYANGHSWDHLDTKACVKAADRIEQLEAENAKLLALLEKARDGLSGGLWDFGPGQDEHDQCNELVAEIDAAIDAAKGGE